MHHTHTLEYENKLTHYIHALHFIHRDIMSELIVAGFGHHNAYPSPPIKDTLPHSYSFLVELYWLYLWHASVQACMLMDAWCNIHCILLYDYQFVLYPLSTHAPSIPFLNMIN
jgi:hypothetical protein